jgi:hypothetical protein
LSCFAAASLLIAAALMSEFLTLLCRLGGFFGELSYLLRLGEDPCVGKLYSWPDTGRLSCLPWHSNHGTTLAWVTFGPGVGFDRNYKIGEGAYVQQKVNSARYYLVRWALRRRGSVGGAPPGSSRARGPSSMAATLRGCPAPIRLLAR